MNRILTVLLLGIVQITLAQDKVSFSEEQDTLVKQRFIDRYENVFMTKVPTRQMFKLAIVGSEIQGSGFNLAYEYKVLPSLSVEGSVYGQVSRFNDGLAYNLLRLGIRDVNFWANAKARWYYNMNKRIRKGLNANNFSGAYIGASYEQSFYRPTYSNTNVARVGLLYGFQSRFFNHGFVDFAVGLYQRESGQFYDFGDSPAFFATENFVLGTHFNIGLAAGDWKRSQKTPFCDVMFCDELIRGHLKVQAPNITIGLRNQIIRTEVAYERAIGKTPLSAQVDAGVDFFNQKIMKESGTTAFSFDANLALRYYFLQRFQQRHGKGGGNFSGPYAGLIGGFSRNTFKSSTIFQPGMETNEASNAFSATAALGYQQRLFKKLYIDVSMFYLKPFPVGGQYISGIRPFLSSKMTVGFTF